MALLVVSVERGEGVRSCMSLLAQGKCQCRQFENTSVSQQEIRTRKLSLQRKKIKNMKSHLHISCLWTFLKETETKSPLYWYISSCCHNNLEGDPCEKNASPLQRCVAGMRERDGASEEGGAQALLCSVLFNEFLAHQCININISVGTHTFCGPLPAQ